MKATVIVRERQTNQDPSGNYDVIYVDVMIGSERVRRFVKPLSKPEISLQSVINKANEFAESKNCVPAQFSYNVN